MATDADGNWINPNDEKLYAMGRWQGVGESNQSNLTTSPSAWLAKITSDIRSAFTELAKFGINPASLLSGNVSLRSLLSSAFGIAAGAARNAALADAKSKFETPVNDEGILWDDLTEDAAETAENGTSPDQTTVIPNITATQDAVAAAEAGVALETYKIATSVLLAIKNGSVESFPTIATNAIMLSNKINAINDAKIAYELDLIDNPDLDATLGSYYVSTPLTQNVSFSSPNGGSQIKALCTPTQSVTANIAGAGFSVRPTNFTEVFTGSSITLKYTPSVITSVTGLFTGTVEGESVILEKPISPSALVSAETEKITTDTYTNSGKTITVSQKVTEYSTIIVRYRTHSSYNPNCKVA